MIPAIVLAGGAGTRLSSVVSEVPKSMAPVNGRPFLEILVSYLMDQGVSVLVLSVGYKREAIQRHFGSRWRGMEIHYCVEEQPLGTGGALKKAMEELGHARAFALNGDTYCPVNLEALEAAQRSAELTLTLKRLDDVGRFGSVELDAAGSVIAFHEKSATASAGLINAGIYVVNGSLFRLSPPNPRFSFETEMMQRFCSSAAMHGFVTDAPFIDIGLPEEFQRAQTLFP